MPNYNLKQIFEIGVAHRAHPIGAMASACGRHGADSILGATTGRCSSSSFRQLETDLCFNRDQGRHNNFMRCAGPRPSPRGSRTKTVTRYAGHMRTITCWPLKSRGHNRGLFVSFPHLEKQREPIVEVQKIKRTWKDKNSIDRRLFEMMLKSSEHVVPFGVLSNINSVTRKRWAIFKEPAGPCRRPGPAHNQQKEIQFKNGRTGRYSAGPMGRLAACSAARDSIGLSGGFNKARTKKVIPCQFRGAGLEARTSSSSLLHSSIYESLPMAPASAGAKLNANSMGRPLEARTLKGYFVTLFSSGDRQVVLGALKGSEAATQKKALSGAAGVRSKQLPSIDEKIEYHTLLNVRKIYNEFSGTKNHIFEFLKTFCNFTLSFEAGAFLRVRNARGAVYGGPALVEQAAGRQLASQDQPSYHSTRKAGTHTGGSASRREAERDLAQSIHNTQVEETDPEGGLQDKYGKNRRRIGFLGMDWGLDLRSKRHSVRRVPIKNGNRAQFFSKDPINLLTEALLEDATPSHKTFGWLKKSEAESKVQATLRPLAVDATAATCHKLPHLFVLNLQFSPFYFCVASLWRQPTENREDGKAPTNHLDKKPWYRPSTIAFLNLYPSAIQNVSSLVAGFYKKPTLSEYAGVPPVQLSNPNDTLEEFTHTTVGGSSAAHGWAALSRHIHQKSIEFVFRTEHIYASIFYLRCYWLYLYNHFFPSEFVFSLALNPEARRFKLEPHGLRAINTPLHGGERPKTQSLLPLKFFFQFLLQKSYTHMQISRTHKMIIETTKTQGAHKILSSNFSARRLKSRYYSSNHCICVPSCPVNETRPGTGGHAKKLISLILLHGHKNQKNQKPNFNDFLLKTTHSDIVPQGGELKSGFAQLNKKEKQSDWNNKNKAKRWASVLNYNTTAQHSVRKAQTLRTDVTLMSVATLIGLSF